MKPLSRPKNLTEQAVEVLRDAIVNDKFMLGEPLSENLLAKSMGISKSPIREALAQLKIEGLVNIIPQTGTFVFTLTEGELVDLIELRFILESSAMRLAFERSRKQLQECLQKKIQEMESHLAAGDIAAYLKSDYQFHRCLFYSCDNTYLCDAYRQISGKFSALSTRITRQPNHPQKTFREHSDIASHVLNGEIDQAVQKLDTHFSSFMEFYRDNLKKIEVSTVSSTRKKRRINNNSEK